jgi:hypothetical protein
MSSKLIEIIASADPSERNRSLDSFCRRASLKDLLAECDHLETFRRQSRNLYQRVRALFFLYAIHRFHLPLRADFPRKGLIPFGGYEHLLERRFEEAIAVFLSAQKSSGPNDAISSALATAYHDLGFQTLSDQVRQSVRSVRGNQWMFRIGHPTDQPLRLCPELLRKSSADGSFSILKECTPVRMDLSHSAWSDIFFLGMDYPEGARVLNVSIDLGVKGRDQSPRPPVEAYLRIIDEPAIRLTSVDLGATAVITELAEIFDFAKDYLGLLKAAVIASGIVPPGMEGSSQSLAELLARMIAPGHGLEIVSSVNNIPKGSRLAVSTNLLGSLISVCMRATGQTKSLTGPLREEERRIVAARAILGEWLAGSGGGWQDSGGIWPGIKLIQGMLATQDDPEFGISRGRLLPSHELLDSTRVSAEARQKLQDTLVLVHGGMAQNVGPILEMVTEKYLLRSEPEWHGRQEALAIFDEILAALQAADIRAVGAATSRNFFGPIQTIIPWAGNYYTTALIDQVRHEFRDHFWGFWMLGGMSGGGMGFIFAPEHKQSGQSRLREIMMAKKQALQHALPFAMDPVVYDFSINETGTHAALCEGANALLPPGYYALVVPELLRTDTRKLTTLKRAELDKFGSACRSKPELRDMVQILFDRLLPQTRQSLEGGLNLPALLDQYGFDRVQHEQIRDDLRSGRIGLAQNRLPASANIKDVEMEDVIDATADLSAADRTIGMDALAGGNVAVISLAAGLGTRWTQGAGIVKALNPFCKLGGEHRSFLEVHLAKSRRTSRLCGTSLPHIFTTGYLTHGPTEAFLDRQKNYGYAGPLLLSPGRAVGARLIPMIRDLRFVWEEVRHQMLDNQKQKLRESLRAALIAWAKHAGEGNDYTDNVPLQCLHPVGHWFEIPNLLRNGILARLLDERPNLNYLLLHNIDTAGTHVDPALLGLHIRLRSGLTFEVIPRRLDDRGGGLARVDGRIRLVEGLAMPCEADEFGLSYYNTMTTWIDLDLLLKAFDLSRSDLANPDKIATAIRNLGSRMPTYVTLKDVKKRWGQGQEDIFPVAQFEKLWGDMTTIPEINCRFVVVPRQRGQQLKDQAQLDGWLRDGSSAYLESLCEWS